MPEEVNDFGGGSELASKELSFHYPGAVDHGRQNTLLAGQERESPAKGKTSEIN